MKKIMILGIDGLYSTNTKGNGKVYPTSNKQINANTEKLVS